MTNKIDKEVKYKLNGLGKSNLDVFLQDISNQLGQPIKYRYDETNKGIKITPLSIEIKTNPEYMKNKRITYYNPKKQLEEQIFQSELNGRLSIDIISLANSYGSFRLNNEAPWQPIISIGYQHPIIAEIYRKRNGKWIGQLKETKVIKNDCNNETISLEINPSHLIEILKKYQNL
jgi:hypothetical protein